jgi:glyoxylase-like metal-dependent hydrolase (beta-lactamase superfamily II)
MIGQWVRRLAWRPFEMACRRTPLVPFRAAVIQVNKSVRLIRIENAITRAISRFGGGYDYSVSYLIEDSLLVDTGFPWARCSLRQTLLDTGAYATLSAVINTHYHEDHTGNNDLLRELCDAPIYAHPSAITEIRYPPELPWYRSFMFGPISPSFVQPVPEHLSTRNHTFEVHHLPGHSCDHIGLFEPEQRWLFSGDLYIAPDLDSQLRDVDGTAWIQSLEHALALSPHCLFDAHGLVVMGEDEVRALLGRKLTFLRELREAVLSVAGQACSVSDVTRAVFQDKGVVNSLSFSDGWLSLLTCSDFSRSNLVRSFLTDVAGEKTRSEGSLWA